MKHISCFSRLHCVLQYSLERSRHSVLMHSWDFLFRMQYIILYFQNRDSCSARSKPKSDFSLQTYTSPFALISDSSSAYVKGAAGSIVRLKSSPQLPCSQVLFIFSTAIMQVYCSSLQGEWRCFSQYSRIRGSKQLDRASAASWRDKLFSPSSSILVIRKCLTSAQEAGGSWPRAQRSSCLRRMELPQCSQPAIIHLIASSVPMFLSWNTAKYRSPMAFSLFIKVAQYYSCISLHC